MPPATTRSTEAETPTTEAATAPRLSRPARVAEAINAMPKVRCGAPEGGFFVWVDIRETGHDDAEIAERLLVERGVAVIPGSAFGSAGAGYLRLSAIRDSVTGCESRNSGGRVP